MTQQAPQGFPFDVAAPDVLELMPYQPGKPIEELERELGISGAIKLASNENPFGPSEKAISALQTSAADVGFYPDANGYYLKQNLASRLGVDEAQLTLGNGSNDVLDLLARVFVRPGDEVVFSEYAFLVYPLVTRATGGRAVVVPAADWGHDLTAMAKAVTNRTKLMFIANPNNPTGTYCDSEQLCRLLDTVPEHVVVVLDEAYFEYVKREDYPDGLSLLSRHPNLVVTRTFSKIYGLAGLRVGYAVASDSITDLLNRVRQPFNVSAPAQAAALAALADEEHVAQCRDVNLEQLARFEQFCEQSDLRFIPSVANFLTVAFGERTPEIYQALLKAGVITRPITNYQMPHHLRISIGRPREMDRLFQTLSRIL